MITDEQKQAYIVSKGVRCLYCGANQIEGGKLDWDDPLAQEITCLRCGKQWYDILTLTDVLEKETG